MNRQARVCKVVSKANNMLKQAWNLCGELSASQTHSTVNPRRVMSASRLKKAHHVHYINKALFTSLRTAINADILHPPSDIAPAPQKQRAFPAKPGSNKPTNRPKSISRDRSVSQDGLQTTISTTCFLLLLQSAAAVLRRDRAPAAALLPSTCFSTSTASSSSNRRRSSTTPKLDAADRSTTTTTSTRRR